MPCLTSANLDRVLGNQFPIGQQPLNHTATPHMLAGMGVIVKYR
jgi:hypothetical protein